MKKIIHELDIDSLIALASGAKPQDIADKLSEASRFIYDLNIKHGDEKISAQLIYHTYKHWKGWDQKRQTKNLFFRDFKKYFEPHRTSEGLCFLLNPKPFDLSDETWWIMRSEIRHEKTKRQNQSNKKKPG